MTDSQHEVELIVERIQNSPPGSVRRHVSSIGGHPADGMTATVHFGEGAYGTIIDPTSFENGGPEWVMRYGNPERIRYAVASLLSTYDYLLSPGQNTKEVIRRLRLMRAARHALSERSSK